MSQACAFICSAARSGSPSERTASASLQWQTNERKYGNNGGQCANNTFSSKAYTVVVLECCTHFRRREEPVANNCIEGASGAGADDDARDGNRGRGGGGAERFQAFTGPPEATVVLARAGK